MITMRAVAAHLVVDVDGAPAAVTSSASVEPFGPTVVARFGELSAVARLTGTDLLAVKLPATPRGSADLCVDLLVGSPGTGRTAALLSGGSVPVQVRAVNGAGVGWSAQVSIDGVLHGNPTSLTLSSGLLHQARTALVRLSVVVLGAETFLLVDGEVVDRRVRLGFTVRPARGPDLSIGEVDTGFVGVFAALMISEALPDDLREAVTSAIGSGIGAIESVADTRGSQLGPAQEPEETYGVMRWKRFEAGTVFWAPWTDSHVVWTEIRDAYLGLGGPIGRLGLPVSEQMSVSEMVGSPPARVGAGLRFEDVVVETIPQVGAGALLALESPGEAVAAAARVRVEPVRSPKDWIVDLTADHGLRDLVEGDETFDVAALRSAVRSGSRPLSDAVVLAPGMFLRSPALDAVVAALGENTVLGNVTESGIADLREILATAGRYDTEARIGAPSGAGWVVRVPKAQRFERGIIVWAADTGTVVLSPDIALHWLGQHGSDGPLGVPFGSNAYGDGGESVTFTGGVVYSSFRTGTHAVRQGPFLSAYVGHGGPLGDLGYPTSEQRPLDGVDGLSQMFEHGELLWSPATGAHTMSGAVREHHHLHDGLTAYGLPVTDQHLYDLPGGHILMVSELERGMLAWIDGYGCFDSIVFRASSIAIGLIDDGYNFLGRDTEAEGIGWAQVSVDGAAVWSRRVPDQGHVGRTVSFPDEPVTIRLHRDLSIEVWMRAWDWDSRDEDLLAEHKVTYVAFPEFFGYAANAGSHLDARSTWDGADADATAVRFSYSLAPEFPADAAHFRRDLWWSFGNFKTPVLSWSDYAATFDDVDPAPDLLDQAGRLLGVGYYDREYKDVAKDGNCFGMSLLALEAWNHRSGLAEPLSRLRQSDALNHDINLRHGVQKGAAFMVLAANASLRHRAFDPREVWERTDAYTSQGVPVLLILKGVKDGENVGHAVVAYRCTRERNHGSDEQWILIADPNVRSAPGQKDKQSYIGIRADGSYYVMRPDGPYFEYEGPPHISGVRGERFLMEAPSSVLAGPHYTPTMAIELGCSWLKLVIASHSSGPIRQVGTTSGLVWFGDRRRAVLQGIKDNRATLVAAAAVLGTAAEEPERDQDPTRVTRSQGALEMIAALTGASLGGPPAPVREVLSAIARVPSDLAQGARDSWSGLGPAVLTTELTDDAVNSIITNLGNYVTVDAWPRMVEVPIDDTAPGSHQLFALQGPVPADLFVQYSAAQSYDLTATASGCAVRVTSILQRAGFDGLDTVKLDRLASARPGVRVSTSAGLGRGVSVALTRHLAGDDRAHVGWKLDLDLATEESELSWAVGRVGAVLTPGSDTPERIIQFAGGPPDNTSQSSYWVPPATASERLQMYPADLASPFGVLHIDRVARLDGRLLDRTEIDPSR